MRSLTAIVFLLCRVVRMGGDRSLRVTEVDHLQLYQYVRPEIATGMSRVLGGTLVAATGT
jgi:hypothetical protein